MNFPDTPKAMAWVGDNLIICIKKDLYHVTVRIAWDDYITMSFTSNPNQNGTLVLALAFIMLYLKPYM